MPIEDFPGLPEEWELRRSFPDTKGNCRWILERIIPGAVRVEHLAEYQEKPTIEMLKRAIASYRGLGK